MILNEYIVYFENEYGQKEKSIIPAIDSSDAEMVIVRYNPMKIIKGTYLKDEVQPSWAEDYILS